MKGVQLFSHSLRQVTGNVEGALRVSAVPFAAQTAASLLLVGRMEGLSMPVQIGPAELLALVVMIATSLWIAVAWHRFILLNERIAGFLPPFRADLIGAYLLRWLGYGLALFPPALVLTMVASALVGGWMVGSPLLASLAFAAIALVPLAVLALRLFTGLPGAALQDGSDFMAGWRATAGQTGDIAVLAAVAVAAHLVVGLVGGALSAALPILGFGLNVILGWFVTMVGVSILTTLYGHYIQGRPLRG